MRGDEVVRADDVGAGGPRLGGAARRRRRRRRAAVSPVPAGSDERAADDLVGAARVDAEPHGELDRLVETSPSPGS